MGNKESTLVACMPVKNTTDETLHTKIKTRNDALDGLSGSKKKKSKRAFINSNLKSFFSKFKRNDPNVIDSWSDIIKNDVFGSNESFEPLDSNFDLRKSLENISACLTLKNIKKLENLKQDELNRMFQGLSSLTLAQQKEGDDFNNAPQNQNSEGHKFTQPEIQKIVGEVVQQKIADNKLQQKVDEIKDKFRKRNWDNEHRLSMTLRLRESHQNLNEATPVIPEPAHLNQSQPLQVIRLDAELADAEVISEEDSGVEQCCK